MRLHCIFLIQIFIAWLNDFQKGGSWSVQRQLLKYFGFTEGYITPETSNLPLCYLTKKKPQAILRNCAYRHTYCWYYFKKETKNQHQLEMQRTCYLGYSYYWDFCKDATNLHYSVLQISILKVMKIDDNYIFELKSRHYIFVMLFCLGSSSQNWSNKDCKSVQIYHRQYSGRKDSGACRNETPPWFHSHSARQVYAGN